MFFWFDKKPGQPYKNTWGPGVMVAYYPTVQITLKLEEIIADQMGNKVIIDDGWNGSYHDAQWHNDCAAVIGIGRRPSQARRRAKKALKILEENAKPIDRVVVRFNARKHVRLGD